MKRFFYLIFFVLSFSSVNAAIVENGNSTEIQVSESERLKVDGKQKFSKACEEAFQTIPRQIERTSVCFTP